jgi:hypothetical protein
MSHPRGLALAFAALTGLALAGCSGPGQKPSAHAGPTGSPRLADLPPKQILSEALAAARAAGSMHSESTSRVGSFSFIFSDDSSASGGRQVITISGGGHMTIVLVAGVGYVRGNAAALAGFLGLPAQTAIQVAGRWISFSKGDPGYQQVVTGVTTQSTLDEITPAGALTKTGVRTLDGQLVVGVRGTVPASAGGPATTLTLYVAATGRPLPVSAQGGQQRPLTVVFSRWGEPVPVAAPRNAIKFPSALAPPVSV